MLVGNKTDRDDREIPAEVGDEFAQRHGMYYLETSAKACDNVDRLFAEIAHELLQVINSPFIRDALEIQRSTYKVTLVVWDIHLFQSQFNNNTCPDGVHAPYHGHLHSYGPTSRSSLH